MWVVTRRNGETIVATLPNGQRITFILLDCPGRGNKTRVGVECPREIELDRGEVRAAKDERKAG